MKLTGAKREQTILIGVVVFGVVILYIYLTVLAVPLWKRFVQLGQEMRTARTKLQQTEQAVAQEPSVRQERDRLTDTIEELGRSLPSEEALPKVIEVLSNVATEAGLRIQTIFPQRSFESAGEKSATAKPVADNLKALYKEIPIQIDALTGFHQLGAFLSRVESNDQAMEVKSLRISSDPKEPRLHDVKLVLRVYFAGAKAKHTAP
jgi:Tfp pilus assembly protein PilO